MQSPPKQPDLIGESRVFLDAMEHASAVAEIDRPVLVVGERGAGKELFAARIHFLSPRWGGPLIKVNCAAMSDELLDSELFGHEAGAFTGAAKKHRGRFERAEGGTLFLDEIAAASSRVQEKLLRVIEYGEYERVGGEKTRSADVRVVAAANLDLREAARQGAFRADLLDRLAFDVIEAPPLRKRSEDIPLLAAHFAGAMAAEIGVPYPGFSSSAMNTLRAHHWPGNVRELKNAVERAIFYWAREQATKQIDDIEIDPFPDFTADGEAARETRSPRRAPLPGPQAGPPHDLRAHLDAIEKQLVIDALREAGGSQTRAAKSLSLTYDQLRGVVRKYALEPRAIGAAAQ
ncbi:MAG: phage shock protein operon transcriptional activator [Pseudomonadota bacterium]